MAEIKKAIIPMAGLGTRFLPLSKAVPKEFWPLAGEPIIHYLLKEAIDSGNLGKIIIADAYVKWWRTQEYYDSGDWRGTCARWRAPR